MGEAPEVSGPLWQGERWGRGPLSGGGEARNRLQLGEGTARSEEMLSASPRPRRPWLQTQPPLASLPRLLALSPLLLGAYLLFAPVCSCTW